MEGDFRLGLQCVAQVASISFAYLAVAIKDGVTCGRFSLAETCHHRPSSTSGGVKPRLKHVRKVKLTRIMVWKAFHG